MERYKQLLLVLAVCMCVLVAAVGNISILKGAKYAHLAAEQRTLSDSGYRTRGIITDRNFIPFTHNAASENKRYSKDQYANHVIGYTDSGGSGISGIEKAFDSELSGGSMYADILLDARGEVIPNFRTVSADNENEGNIKLTLDYHIQKICENVLDNTHITGSVVVLDVDSFDVLAMVSRPDFERGEIDKYISSNGTELLNRATAPYNCGSIFKIVTAAAFLEERDDADKFLSLCRGGFGIDNLYFGCHKENGHGLVSLEEAFAKSCNCAFYDMGVSLGGKTVCDYAKAFGMGSNAAGGILTENSGNVPKYFAGTKAESANLSIGQGELMITPLQAAKLTCAIACGGVVKSVNIADCVFAEDGKVIKNLRRYWTKRIISAETAEKIGAMMLKTTIDGTGTNAYSDLVAIAGKTGSAETGWQTDDGYMVQGWFVGFFPYENPRYAMAIMTENGRQGNTSCAPVFKDIAEKIMEIKNFLKIKDN